MSDKRTLQDCYKSKVLKLQSKEESNSKKNLPRLRVLSLFDGIGTGYYALKQLDFDVEVFYASEIDSNALLLTWSHFGSEINQLGSVVDIDEMTLDKIGPINLLMGGSPCSDLSCVNHRKKGLYDATGTGVLFFEYYRIWNLLKKKQIKENSTFYWMYENVANMELKHKNIISQFLECDPYVLDSFSLTPQRRRRFFWSNIPNIESLQCTHSTDDNYGPVLDEYLDKNLGRKANVNKIGTITTKRNCLQDGNSRDPVNQNGQNMGLYITELEKIFGFTAHYTDVGDLSINDRQKLLGKAWSVPVVKSIFKLLQSIFAIKKN
ncbi:DNA (cytosine-5)-methyltransferase 3C-like [Daktulosphaira vitifoliae]|uniref:DNA (cytosine-5)-methyltransferase 3C-like n=1 Tax=Daktulosphaira vitifoliae TaxID=58002 RepID=UPI0021AA90B6|nr:DNA (cytosine-5)-methyltransferase 3C-like [Daktulosphaira vitifoliae]